MAHDMALLREVDNATQLTMDYLSLASIEDIHEDELVILTAILAGVSPQVIAELSLDLVMNLGRITDGLILRGYLEFRDNRNVPGRRMVAPTKRGSAVCALITKAAMIKRWADFPFRQDDIVIATFPKSGTTWMQMICALLVFQTSDLPGPLQELSPWIDWGQSTRDEVYTKLAVQEHRRFIKTHLILKNIPIDPRVTYIVIGRHPLDSAASFYHVHMGGPQVDEEHKESGAGELQPDPPIPSPREALLRFIDEASDTHIGTGPEISLACVMEHLSYAWARRDQPNVVLLHYEDLLVNLEGQMRRLAERLGIVVPEVKWPGLVKAATFEQMRAAAGRLQPLPQLKDQPGLFFRSGRSGSGRELLGSADLARYHERAAQLGPPDLLAWLHRQDGSA